MNTITSSQLAANYTSDVTTTARTVRNTFAAGDFSSYLSNEQPNPQATFMRTEDSVYSHYDKNTALKNLDFSKKSEPAMPKRDWIHDNQTVETHNYKLSLAKDYANSYIFSDNVTGVVHDIINADEVRFLRDENSGKLFMASSPHNSPIDICMYPVNKELENALCEFFGIDELPTEDMSENNPLMASMIHTDKASGITYVSSMQGGATIIASIVYDSQAQRDYVDNLARTYEQQYPHIVDSAISKSWALGEITGSNKRLPDGILSYGGRAISFYDKRGITKSWRIVFSEDVDDVKKLFAGMGIDIEKITRNDFQYWQDLLLYDARFEGIASKIEYAGEYAEKV